MGPRLLLSGVARSQSSLLMALAPIRRYDHSGARRPVGVCSAWGASVIGWLPVEQLERGGVDLVLVRQRGPLEVRGIGQRHLRHPDAADGRVEVVEAGALDPGGQLG